MKQAKPVVFREGEPPADGQAYVRFVQPIISGGAFSATVGLVHLYSVIDVPEEIAVSFLDCGEIDPGGDSRRWRLSKADAPTSKPWLKRDWLATLGATTVRAKTWAQLMSEVLSRPRVCASCGQAVKR